MKRAQNYPTTQHKSCKKNGNKYNVLEQPREGYLKCPRQDLQNHLYVTQRTMVASLTLNCGK